MHLNTGPSNHCKYRQETKVYSYMYKTTCIQMWIINDEYKTVTFMVYDTVHINKSKKYKHFWHSFNVQIPRGENDQE